MAAAAAAAVEAAAALQQRRWDTRQRRRRQPEPRQRHQRPSPPPFPPLPTLTKALMARRDARLKARLLGPASPAFCSALASCFLRESKWIGQGRGPT